MRATWRPILTSSTTWDSDAARDAYEAIQREILRVAALPLQPSEIARRTFRLSVRACQIQAEHMHTTVHVIAPGAHANTSHQHHHQPTTSGTHTPG